MELYFVKMTWDTMYSGKPGRALTVLQPIIHSHSRVCVCVCVYARSRACVSQGATLGVLPQEPFIVGFLFVF